MSSRVRNLHGSQNLFAPSAPGVALSAAGEESAWLASLALSVDSASRRRELLSLRAERDPELLAGGLLSFAGRHADDPSLALRIYQRIADSAEFYGAALARLAHDRVEALQGRGNFGDRSEIFVRRFVHEVANPATLASMAVAGGVFQGLRLASYSRLLASAEASFLTRGLGARGLSFGIGFAAEAPAFTAAHRGLSALLGQEPSGASFGQELAGGYLMLGGLRLSSAAGTALLRSFGPAGGLTGTVSQRLFQQGTMFAGITAAHWAEERLGLRPQNGGAALLADSLAALLQFNASGRLLHSLGGGQGSSGLELRIRSLENYGPSRMPLLQPLHLGPELALEGPMQMSAEISGKGPQRPPILLTTGGATLRRSGPIERNPRLYLRYRGLMSECEFGIHRLLLEMNSGSPLWVETALHIARSLYENSWAELSRVPPEHAPYQARLVQQLEQLQTNLELIRASGQPRPMDANAQELLRFIYRVPNKIVNYVNSGEHEDLEGAIHNAVSANELFTREFRPVHAVNQDSGEILPELSPPLSGGRVVRASERPWTEDSLPFYDYVSDYVEDVPPQVDIAPEISRRVLLLGEIPRERGNLALHHEVSVSETTRHIHRDLLTENLTNAINKAPNQIRLLSPRSNDTFDYVEAFDAFNASRLLSESGAADLQRYFFDRIRPGGIGLWISRDSRATELAVHNALDRRLAGVIIGSYSGNSPLQIPSRPDYDTTNFVFFKKLPNE